MPEKNDIQTKVSNLYKRIRNFLLSTKNREFLIFLFFFFIASIFWLIQTLNEEYEAEFSTPIRVKNVPNDVVVTLPLPEKLHFTVKDKGTVLANYQFAQSFYPLIIDFENYTQAGNHIHIPTSSLQKNIASQLISSSKIGHIRPDTLNMIYTRGKSRKIPIRLQGNYTPGQQYYIANVTYIPDSVTVYAPDNILDTLRYAYTEPINVNNLTDTTVITTKIKGSIGSKYIPDVVNVRFTVDMYSEKSVEVTIKGSDFPTNKSLKTFPSKVKVTFQVGLTQFKNINADDFSIEIPYDALLNHHSDMFPISLKEFPKEIKHIRISPQVVDFLIEQNVPHEY